jgi:hypothetical protein
MANIQIVNDEIIYYNGHELPRDKVTPKKQGVDETNLPSLVILSAGLQDVTLPPDTAIYLDGKKTIATSKILDGVTVYERIMRDPYSIEFEMVIRQKNDLNQYVFGQDDLDNLWTNIWLQDTVVNVQNTLLNRLGIFEVVVETITPTTVRGTTNIPVRLKCYENVPGTSIIIN